MCLDTKCETKANWGKKKEPQESASSEGAEGNGNGNVEAAPAAGGETQAANGDAAKE